MSYQVLARKWRPNRFSELVGQEHVVSAITNALDNDRLHHAYLFTGTRGVGKTTIARIFSKSLNCEQGQSANPCGQCSTCVEIENGNFIDLLEIDAASRTKVEDTRELLDNVQYKPSRGKYKVYLIDEVHMLSKHSFNALLKTLEEPPPHVKFLLATTDPQKLPVTILSRCLQFNLKALSREQITQQLEHVLGQEQLGFDLDGLKQLARAAQGSMRDALSLTDQAIAQGNGVVSLGVVTSMLGLMDKNQVLKLIHGIVEGNTQGVFAQVEALSVQAPNFAQVLAEMMSLLHQIALTQFVPDACKLETISARAIYQLAKSIPAEQVQLYYQIVLAGAKDLPHAADPKSGFEMVLLRLLAFSPKGVVVSSDDLNALNQEQAKLPDLAQSSAPEARTSTESQPQDLDKAEIAQPSPVVAEPISDNETQLKANVEQTSQIASFDYEPSKPAMPDAVSQVSLEAPAVNLPHDADVAPQDLPMPAQDFDYLEPSNDEPSHQAGLGTHDAHYQQSPDQAPSLPLEPSYSAPEFNQAIEQQMFAEQETIIEQARDYGFAEPVSRHNETQELAPVQPPQHSEQPSPSSTAELIALRNKIKQNQSSGEGDLSASKKSDTSPNFASPQPVTPSVTPNTHAFLPTGGPEGASLSSQVNTLDQTLSERANETKPDRPDRELNKPSVKPVSGEMDKKSNNIQSLPSDPNELPPWLTEDMHQPDTHASLINAMQAQPVAEREPEPEFDPNAHLDSDNVGKVDAEVPAFLPNKQKVTKSEQLDDWSALIEQMNINALTKQLALHSSFSRVDSSVTLTLLEGKEHLNSPSAREMLSQALSQHLGQAVNLTINMGQPVNTPYGLQIKINQVRQDYARQVIEQDAGVCLLQQRFSAKVDETSIQAR